MILILARLRMRTPLLTVLFVSVVPAATMTSSSIVQGATICVSEPTNTFLPMMVLYFFLPS